MDEQRSRADRRKEARAKPGRPAKLLQKKYHKKQKTFAWWRTPYCVCVPASLWPVVSLSARWGVGAAAAPPIGQRLFLSGITVDGVDLSA